MDADIIDGPSSFTLENQKLPFSFHISAPSMKTAFKVEEVKKCDKNGGWKIKGRGRIGSSEELKSFSATYNSQTYTGVIKIVT